MLNRTFRDCQDVGSCDAQALRQGFAEEERLVFGFERADFADQFAVAFGRLSPIHPREDAVAGSLVDVAVAGLAGELHHGEGDQRIAVAEFQQAV